MTDTVLNESFFEILNELLSRATSNTFILTDININNLIINNNSRTLMDLASSYSFINAINLATRITYNTTSAIDHIYLNNTEFSYTSGVILSDISDHLPIFLGIGKKSKTQNTNLTEKRSFSKDNINIFTSYLENYNWNMLYSCTEAEQASEIFFDVWDSLFNLCFPLKQIRKDRSKCKLKDFYTNGLLISRKQKLFLYKKFLASRTSSNETNYKKYRNLYNRVCRCAKQMFFEEKVDLCRDPKTAWSYLNMAVNKRSNKNGKINNICVNGINISDSKQMADQFNNFFASVPDDIVKTIPSTSANFLDYLNYDVNENFNFRNITYDSVLEIINKLESKTTLDINGYNTIVIKKVADKIVMPLTHVINMSLKEGFFPDNLKISRTCPIFKQGPKSDMSNYRPISCLPIFSKIFERVVYDQLSLFLTVNRLIYNHQYGFQRGKSTTDALLNILNYITGQLNENKIVVASFLDLRKAFDLVSNKILLRKLDKMGVRGTSLKWFKSYLGDRKMYTMVNESLSSKFSILNRSVPQGSILGPLLFLIFINDMPQSNNLLNFLFADDTTAVTSGNDFDEIERRVNLELQKTGGYIIT